MAEPTVAACLDGGRTDLNVIDVARRRALLGKSVLRLVSIADPAGPAIELTASGLVSLTGLQILCRSSELPQPPRRRGLRPRRPGGRVYADSLVIAEEHYAHLPAIDAQDGEGRPSALVRVQPRWPTGPAPELVGVCVTHLREVTSVMRTAIAEIAREHVGLRIVYASRRSHRNWATSAGGAQDIARELAQALPGPVTDLEVVAEEPYRLLTEMSHSCRSVVIPGSPAIFRTGPEGWRYPADGCPLIVALE